MEKWGKMGKNGGKWEKEGLRFGDGEEKWEQWEKREKWRNGVLKVRFWLKYICVCSDVPAVASRQPLALLAKTKFSFGALWMLNSA